MILPQLVLRRNIKLAANLRHVHDKEQAKTIEATEREKNNKRASESIPQCVWLVAQCLTRNVMALDMARKCTAHKPAISSPILFFAD